MAQSKKQKSESRQESWASKQVFTTGEAAEICNVSQQTIIRCFDSDRLGGFRVPGSRFRRIPRADLMRFMKENEIPLDVLERGPRRILVVDDESEIVSIICEVLGADPNYELKSASTGYDAGLLTESFKPHLIVLDYMLPDLNGDLVCERVKSAEASRNTQVLFISGVCEPEEIDRLKAIGADGFLKKPFDITQLVESVSSLLAA